MHNYIIYFSTTTIHLQCIKCSSIVRIGKGKSPSDRIVITRSSGAIFNLVTKVNIKYVNLEMINMNNIPIKSIFKDFSRY